MAYQLLWGKILMKKSSKTIKIRIFRIRNFPDFFLDPKLFIKKYPLEKEIISLHGLDCKIRISGFPDPDFFEHFLGQSYFFSTNSMLAKFQLNWSCRFGAVKYESDYPLKKALFYCFEGNFGLFCHVFG